MHVLHQQTMNAMTACRSSDGNKQLLIEDTQAKLAGLDFSGDGASVGMCDTYVHILENAKVANQLLTRAKGSDKYGRVANALATAMVRVDRVAKGELARLSVPDRALAATTDGAVAQLASLGLASAAVNAEASAMKARAAKKVQQTRLHGRSSAGGAAATTSAEGGAGARRNVYSNALSGLGGLGGLGGVDSTADREVDASGAAM